MVHAREGRLLRVVGGGGAAAGSSFGAGAGLSESGSGDCEVRSPGTGRGDPLDMMREIKRGFREVMVRLHVEDHGVSLA